ncbi:MAG: hypothetical protein K2L12_02330 [Clostridia bacterium]|nr:hypothetical protein [Clostridia bacterium]
MKNQYPRKNLIFKSVYLFCSAALMGYLLYLLIDFIAYGFKSGVTFDDCIVLISSVIAALFHGSMIGFIVRSYRAPTLLMKNLVFKNDGTPYKPGIIVISIGAVMALAISIVFGISAYGTKFIDISMRAQYFIFSVGLIMLTHLAFSDAYFVVYRHESGTFTII